MRTGKLLPVAFGHLGTVHRYLRGNFLPYRIAILAAPLAVIIAIVGLWMKQPSYVVPCPVSEPTCNNGGGHLSAAALYNRIIKVPGDHTALNDLKALAEKGDVVAETDMGVLYYKGVGVTQDFGQAAIWYRKAAEQGVAAAEYNLGTLYEQGEGVRQDWKQAFTWYSEAAEQGDANAEFSLGALYQKGNGISQDYRLAADWYRKAADQGNKQAQFSLGLLYEGGYGVKRDDGKALTWCRGAETLFRDQASLSEAALAKNPNDDAARQLLRLDATHFGSLAYLYLLNGDFEKGLAAAELSVHLAPDLIWLQTNVADALMLLGRTDEARSIYLRYRSVQAANGKSWINDVLSDFADLRSKGYTQSLMTEIEQDFAEGAPSNLKSDPEIEGTAHFAANTLSVLDIDGRLLRLRGVLSQGNREREAAERFLSYISKGTNEVQCVLQDDSTYKCRAVATKVRIGGGLIANGFAAADPAGPARLQRYQDEARRAHRGMWDPSRH